MKKLALCLLAALALCFAPTAHAVYVLTLQEVGPDVVATGSGSFDTADLLVFMSGETVVVDLAPFETEVGVGLGPVANVYLGANGPTSFGPGMQDVLASSATGNLTVFAGFIGGTGVPEGYVSGSPLAGSATFDNQNFATLGFTPGTYVYTWGIGADAHSLRVVSVAPEPSHLGNARSRCPWVRAWLLCAVD